LALSEEQVGRILATVEETGNDRVMVGFNRRFAPLFVHLREHFRRTDAPVTARYLVNAGRLDPTSWYLKSDTEGSRFAGEGGHFVDTLSALVGHDPVQVTGQSGPAGDVLVSLRYPVGSLGSI
jgi:predicted dehydrogenase